MRRCDIGGTVLVRSLRPRSVASEHGICMDGRNGAGIWMKCSSASTATPLSLARRRPGGRSPRSLCYQEPQSQGGLEVSAQSDKTIRSTENNRHRQAWLLPGSAKEPSSGSLSQSCVLVSRHPVRPSNSLARAAHVAGHLQKKALVRSVSFWRTVDDLDGHP